MVCRPVDHTLQNSRNSISAVVNRNGPEVNKQKQNKVQDLVERKQKHEQVIRQALKETVYGMESVASIGSGDDPAVMRFVNILVHPSRLMKCSVN